MDRLLTSMIPHAAFGDPGCSGRLSGVVVGNQAAIACAKCVAVIRTVPLFKLQRTLDKMELSLNVAVEICPHCECAHLALGVAKLATFVCGKCGRTSAFNE